MFGKKSLEDSYEPWSINNVLGKESLEDSYQSWVTSLRELGIYNENLEGKVSNYDREIKEICPSIYELKMELKNSVRDIRYLQDELREQQEARWVLHAQKISQIEELKKTVAELRNRVERKSLLLKERLARQPVYEGFAYDYLLMGKEFVAQQRSKPRVERPSQEKAGCRATSKPDLYRASGSRWDTTFVHDEGVFIYVPAKKCRTPVETEDPMLRDVEHLYQFKLYVDQKLTQKSFAKELIPVAKEGMQKALLTFSETLIGAFTEKGQAVGGPLNVRPGELMEEFRGLLEPSFGRGLSFRREKESCMELFEGLVRKFIRKFPFVEMEKEGCCGLFTRLFKTKRSTTKELAFHLGLLKEIFSLKKVHSKGLEESLAGLQLLHEGFILEKARLERYLPVVRGILQEVKDSIVEDKERFSGFHISQDNEIKRLSGEAKVLRKNLLLKDIGIRLLRKITSKSSKSKLSENAGNWIQYGGLGRRSLSIIIEATINRFLYTDSLRSK